MDPLAKLSPPAPQAGEQALGFFLTWGRGGDPAAAHERALLLAKGLAGPEAPGEASAGHHPAEGRAQQGVSRPGRSLPRRPARREGPPDLLDRLLAVGLVDAEGAGGADAVAVQEDHDLPDRLLLGPGGGDLLQPHLADAFHRQELLGVVSMAPKTAVPNLSTSRRASLGAMPLTMPLPRYLAMPSAVSGWLVFSTSARNCWPWVGSTAHRPSASTHSPSWTSDAVPTTVRRSRCPFTCKRSTTKPFSALWKVTRSIRPVRCSRSEPAAVRTAEGF
jgi:hypothetical protein